MIRRGRTAVLPTRPHRPRDKAKVETAVLIIERWMLARVHSVEGIAQIGWVASRARSGGQNSVSAVCGYGLAEFHAALHEHAVALGRVLSDYRDWLDYTIVEDGRRDVGRRLRPD
jgi:hypothetical protein